MKFMRWARASLLGHVVFFEVLGTIPITLVFIYLNYTDGTLTVAWAVWIFFVVALATAVTGALFWYTSPRPRKSFDNSK